MAVSSSTKRVGAATIEAEVVGSQAKQRSFKPPKLGSTPVRSAASTRATGIASVALIHFYRIRFNRSRVISIVEIGSALSMRSDRDKVCLEKLRNRVTARGIPLIARSVAVEQTP